MKRLYLHGIILIFLFLIINGCKKTISYQSNEPLTDYMPMQIGKYITYRLDSTEFLNFGTEEVIASFLVRDVVDDSITDNLGRPSWRVIRYISDTTGTLPWTPIETNMVTITRETIEVVENNLRFQKLKLPIVNGFTWKGNSYIDTRSFNTPYDYLDNWDYTYDSVGMPYSVLAGTIPQTLIVRQRDTTGDIANINQNPLAVPGPSMTIALPVNSVKLDGSQSTDPNGFITGYSWSQLNGPSVATLTDTNRVAPTMSDLQAGEYIFQLKIIDNNGLVSLGQIKIVVIPLGSNLPVANAGADQSISLPDNSVVLDGSASSAPGGNIVSYKWTKSPGDGTITNPDNAVTQATGLSQGNYIFTLVVTDNNGATATDYFNVNVGPLGITEKDYSIEVYGKGIGLIYKNFFHSSYQPPNAGVPVASTSGYGIILNMVDHN